MLFTIIIIGIALVWLMRETNNLKVHLLVGPYHAPIVYQYEDWETIKTRLENMPRKAMPSYIRLPESYTPLCGWDWLENRQHVIPVNKIQLDFGTRRYDMTVNDPDKLKDIIKVNTVRRNVNRKPKIDKGLTYNPHYTAHLDKLLIEDKELVEA